MPLIDLTGQIFGRLTVISRVPSRDEITYWQCRCVCGKNKVVGAAMLRRKANGTRSCGCIRQQQRLGRPFEGPYKALLRVAKKSSLRVTITYEEFLAYTNVWQCHYCLAAINWMPHKRHGVGTGYFLDRKDSGRGYHKNNVVVCCNRCNKGKSNLFTYDEWVQMTAVIQEGGI